MRALLAAALVAPGIAAAAAGSAERVPARAEPLPAPGKPVPLANADFESAARAGERCAAAWHCSMHADPNSFTFTLVPEAASGRQALCVDRVSKEPWAIATQAVPAEGLRGARVRFSIAVRTDGSEGATIGPLIFVHGQHNVVATAEQAVGLTRGWERVAVELQVAANARLVEIGAQMKEGGRACIDDARLELLP
jgi:hypothetical protein